MNERIADGRGHRHGTEWIPLAIVFLLIASVTLMPIHDKLTQPPTTWCFTCGSNWLSDWISNVVLFLPWGVSLTARRRSFVSTFALGAMLSLTIELCQATGITAGRTPSVADWTANALGTAIGALLHRARGHFLAPTVRRAREMSVAWGIALGLAFFGATWALTPTGEAARTRSRELEPIVTSSEMMTPAGYGWYAGIVDSVEINGHHFLHRGSGPVMLALLHEWSASDSLRLAMRVRGSDPRSTLLPLLYLHGADEVSAVVLVAQQGDAVVLRSQRRGDALGLHPVDVVSISSAAVSNAPRWVFAEISRGGMSVQIAPNQRRHSVLLTPALGWLFMQTIVSTGSTVAPLLTAVWLIFWFFGGGWLSGRGWGVGGGLLWTAIAFFLVWLSARSLDMPILSLAQRFVALFAAVGGVACSRNARKLLTSRPMETII